MRWAVGLTWGPTHLAWRWVGGVEEDANETKPIKATASVRVIAEQLTAMVAGSGAVGADRRNLHGGKKRIKGGGLWHRDAAFLCALHPEHFR